MLVHAVVLRGIQHRCGARIDISMYSAVIHVGGYIEPTPQRNLSRPGRGPIYVAVNQHPDGFRHLDPAHPDDMERATAAEAEDKFGCHLRAEFCVGDLLDFASIPVFGRGS
jgi:hypothetical protein